MHAAHVRRVRAEERMMAKFFTVAPVAARTP
jgi:hypothetical protein